MNDDVLSLEDGSAGEGKGIRILVVQLISIDVEVRSLIVELDPFISSRSPIFYLIDNKIYGTPCHLPIAHHGCHSTISC